MVHKNFICAFAVLIGVVLSMNAHAASISGTIKFNGEAPKFKEIKMDADPVCVTHHTDPVYPQTLVLGDGNTMSNVFVRVKSGLKPGNYPAPAEEIVIDQKGCQYHPHVVGLMAGQSVKVLNPDGTLHNVHILSKVNPEENVAMPKFRKDITIKFEKPEPAFAIKCDVHPWMGAWVTVQSNPFFSVTTTDGKFTIANLPAGTYEIEAWHEKLGTQIASVTVGDSDNATQDFSFAAPTKK
jgi:plastocyanin